MAGGGDKELEEVASFVLSAGLTEMQTRVAACFVELQVRAARYRPLLAYVLRCGLVMAAVNVLIGWVFLQDPNAVSVHGAMRSLMWWTLAGAGLLVLLAGVHALLLRLVNVAFAHSGLPAPILARLLAFADTLRRGEDGH